MAKIMIQGTGSSVGKSLIVAALCRIFKQDGYSVCPYKSQNMSLNSYITMDGKEMGRAQVLQAYAAGLEPQVFMNPILLKPTADTKCQVIVNGKVYNNQTAEEYHNLKVIFKDMLKEQFLELEKEFDIVVMEGAGSPAEINLRDRDIVNMGMAELVDAPVIIVGDIDKGGVFAALAGTMLLLTDEERERVKGTIINKFRGDIKLLKPGVDMLENIIKRPSLGVVPYFNLVIEDEDGAMIEINKQVTAEIDAAVIMLPHISNFTDADCLRCEEDVSVRFIERKEEFGKPDLLIIPGSKNTIEDLRALKDSGLEKEILNYSKEGIILGICGGYQMLGKEIRDPLNVESSINSIVGIGLLDTITTLENEKVMTRVEGSINLPDFQGKIYGYEIHMGRTILNNDDRSLATLNSENGKEISKCDGIFNKEETIFGTYIHGILDSTEFRQYLLNKIRTKKSMSLRKSPVYEGFREEELNKLADIVRNSLDMKKIYEILGLKQHDEFYNY
ncbi:cobyric acid synthase [Clostridium sp. YIM B02515]|uniref:Cobyric acid synthase n=1 Tax=Clostridium rhizosphaerae TaxID=2803861 RepID=A0ABS1TA37_9CLOT|nr:cobyric acid synthase [Clostridium rhizosphaerae]MBL4936200.1 cobyric acid synthase [Clostridium rhizosphaerae]